MTAEAGISLPSVPDDPWHILLKPLCRARLQLGERFLMPGTLGGRRLISETVSLEFEGERLRASLRGRANADWLVISDDGKLGAMDVRMTVETDDGALIYVQYNGRMRYSIDESPHVLYVAPRFETGDVRYTWLNSIQAVGKGLLDGRTRHLNYRFYEVV